MEYTRPLATAASVTGKVKYAFYVASVHWEASLALCKGTHVLFRAGVQLYTRAAGKACVESLLYPSAERE